MTNTATQNTIPDDNDFKVIRKLKPQIIEYSEDLRSDPDIKQALFIDTETTGLDSTVDEIIEIGIVPFLYSKATGGIIGCLEPFNSFQEPSQPLSEEITDITGITNEMLKGQSINKEAIKKIVLESSFVVAHHANFDRPFVEKIIPSFCQIPWGCSLEDVPWRQCGLSGGQLLSLAYQSGFYYDAHRAITDCYAGIELLKIVHDKNGVNAFQHVLDRGRRPYFRLWAQFTPYELKNSLKKRKYLWNDGTDGRPKSWYTDKMYSEVENELSFLNKEIYQRENDNVIIRKIEPSDRFTNRC
ncbi:3'-5' exonuclease [Acetobacter pasteurianus]|uniref:3'-5' exonuclease n=1 Tax=Acetobacter pasteurianus TaxID=438 RepID=UPI001362B5BF|nr:3'-5' exonuclease [Acetobacter pasteurianus]QHM90181.1 3'-5' exonuclease [Acetobacter pasteurianus]